MRPSPVCGALYRVPRTSVIVAAITSRDSAVRDTPFLPHPAPTPVGGVKGGSREVLRSPDRHWDPRLTASRVLSFQEALKFLRITHKLKEGVRI